MSNAIQRPVITAEIIKTSALIAAKSSTHWLELEDIDAMADDIARVYQSDMDGYALTRALEEDSIAYTGSTELVCEMDRMNNHVNRLHLDACRQWAKSIVPPFEMGTRIKQGVINSIADDDVCPAAYLVRETGHDDANGRHRLIVKFEDAEIVKGESI